MRVLPLTGFLIHVHLPWYKILNTHDLAWSDEHQWSMFQSFWVQSTGQSFPLSLCGPMVILYPKTADFGSMGEHQRSLDTRWYVGPLPQLGLMHRWILGNVALQSILLWSIALTIKGREVFIVGTPMKSNMNSFLLGLTHAIPYTKDYLERV